MNLVPLTRFEWEKTVRQVVMPATTKLVAFCLATYADRTGTNARPGRKRLAAECGVSRRTVERQLAWLQEKGLLAKTFDGQTAGRRGLASVYRLVIAEDLADRVRFVNATSDTDDERSDDELSTLMTDDPPELSSPETGSLDTDSGSLVTGDADLSSPMSTHQTNDQNNHHQGLAPSQPLRRALAATGQRIGNTNLVVDSETDP